MSDLCEHRSPIRGPQAQDGDNPHRHGAFEVSDRRPALVTPQGDSLATRIVGMSDRRSILAAAFTAVADAENAVGTVETRHFRTPRSIGPSKNRLSLCRSVQIHRLSQMSLCHV